MSSPPLIYRLALRAVSLAAPVVGWADAKVARGLAGRRGVAGRMQAWAARHRDPARSLVWMHAPSVGEGLQAKPVLERVRRRHPDWQLVYTFFSPSAEQFARGGGLPVDFADYLPADLPGPVAAALDALRPTAMVFAAADVWPELALAAAARGVRLGLISAAVAPGSARLRWPVQSVIASAYGALDRVGAVDEQHARRLVRLGCGDQRVTVTGDTRYDSALERAATFGRGEGQPGLAARLKNARASTLVAGSTWPPDDAEVLAAFAEVRARARPEHAPRLILAPHEPDPPHLSAVLARAASLGLPTPVPLDVATAESPLIVVDRVGVLAELYGAADLAYVGGGYHRAGLHSVLEPAVFGIPVVVGPRWTRSRDAALLLERGGAVALPEAPHGRVELAARWLAWLAEPESRARMGAVARSVLDGEAGAADRTTALVEELTTGRPRPRT